MSILTRWYAYLCIALLGILLCGCFNVEKATRRATRGALLGLTDPQVEDSLENLANRLGGVINRQVLDLRDSLLTNARNASLEALVDSLARNAARGALLGVTDPQVRDSLDLLADRLGQALNRQVTALRDSLLGRRSRDALAALSNRLGGVLNRQVMALRDSLLGPVTARSLNVMIDSLTAGLARNFEGNLQPLLRAELDSLRQSGREDIGFIKKNAVTLLITAGVVIIAIIVVAGLFFVRSRKNRKTLEMVTHQIHQIPNQQIYDDLTGRIRKRALEERLEPHLQKVLQQQGLKG